MGITAQCLKRLHIGENCCILGNNYIPISAYLFPEASAQHILRSKSVFVNQDHYILPSMERQRSTVWRPLNFSEWPSFNRSCGVSVSYNDIIGEFYVLFKKGTSKQAILLLLWCMAHPAAYNNIYFVQTVGCKICLIICSIFI